MIPVEKEYLLEIVVSLYWTFRQSAQQCQNVIELKDLFFSEVSTKCLFPKILHPPIPEVPLSDL